MFSILYKIDKKKLNCFDKNSLILIKKLLNFYASFIILFDNSSESVKIANERKKQNINQKKDTKY